MWRCGGGGVSIERIFDMIAPRYAQESIMIQIKEFRRINRYLHGLRHGSITAPWELHEVCHIYVINVSCGKS